MIKLPETIKTLRIKKPPLLLAAALILSALFLLTGSKSSPLYPMNDNVDLNVYMTVGREMLAGQVPYRDLFEQKGPLLFMLHAFLAIFFKQGYFGVYLLELICFALLLFYSARICRLYVKNPLAPYLVMVFLGIALPLAPSFNNAGSLEEIFLFCFTQSAYFVLRALREDRPLALRECLIIGLYAGFGFWSKYTFCGFFAALALFVIIWYASRKWWRQILISAGQMLAGLAIMTLPVLLYFGLKGALKDLFQVYFIDNMTLYAKTDAPVPEKVLNALKLTTIRNKSAYTWLFWPGGAFLLFGLYKHWRESLFILLCFWGLAITTYMSSPGYTYYGLSLAPFALCGLVGIAHLIDRLLPLFNAGDLTYAALPRPAAFLLGAAALLILAGGTLAIGTFAPSAYLMKYKKADLPQYQFAETIRQTPDATLLNYWFLDGGFYYTAGARPVNRFFCYFNINPPELKTEQENVILKGEVDYVVCRRNPLPDRILKNSPYELVRTANFFFSYRYYDYFLYKRVETP